MNTVYKSVLFYNRLKTFVPHSLSRCFSSKFSVVSSLSGFKSGRICSDFNNTIIYLENEKLLNNPLNFCKFKNNFSYQVVKNFHQTPTTLLNKTILFQKFSQFSDRYCKNSFRYYSSKKSDIRSQIIPLKTKKRIQRKKQTVDEHSDLNAEGFYNNGLHKFLTFDPDFAIPDKAVRKKIPREFQIVAYATADEYELESLSAALIKQGLYVEIPIVSPLQDAADTPESGPDDVLHFGAAYKVTTEPRTMYIFRNGSIVFWNMPSLERRNFIKFLRNYENQSYDEEVVQEESETLVYAYADSNARIVSKQNLISLNALGDKNLEKFTFSNALAMSVKLGIWEASLEKYIENIEHVTEELQNSGAVVLNQSEVLQKLGQLFALRHLINLSSDLLDIPDFYWDHDNLENLYTKMSAHLSISKRTSVMNYKINYCLELMELLQSHLHDRHASRLEWIIIILIMIEVFFEILHFI
ncbi:UNVERIFIED_CONTAM: hypothetical protein RMT77_013140 [Armadillidium vulgare]